MLSNRFAAGLLVLSLLLAACRQAPTPAAGTATIPTPGETGEEPAESGQGEHPAETATHEPPTPTPSEPLAALVNGQPLFLTDYEKELARYERAQAELGLAPAEGAADYRRVVLDALIETELIAQEAAARGVEITREMVEARWAELVELSGGTENFNAWLLDNQWSEQEFIQALQTELLVERMVSLVTADVPGAVEQVRARYLQVDDLTLAQSLRDQITDGADFAALAQQYSLDRITGENGGELSFFARGSLLVPAVEEVAFALEPGGLSEVINAPTADGSGSTYYLVQTLERDPARPLTTDMRYVLLQERFEGWLAELWERAEITRFAVMEG
jgi:parvulin-like peptidyl-prolyl isomerase